MKITTSKKNTKKLPKSYVHVAITNDSTWKTVEYESGVKEIVCGIGKKKEMTPHGFRMLLRKIIRTAHTQKFEKLSIDVDDLLFDELNRYDDNWALQTIAENFLLAHYEYTKYKTDKKAQPMLKEVLLIGNLSSKQQKGLKEGLVIGEHTNLCRDIANSVGGDMTPAALAKEAQKASKGTKVKVSVLDKKAIEKLKMGLLSGVAQGSKLGPRFIIMEYYGAGKPTKNEKNTKKRPLVYVGKGITFDTGGLSIKPAGAMVDMHMDMSGGAAVISAVACAAKLGLKKNIIGLIPVAENAVSDDSMRPGDILTSMSGKTVDVLNTDAEGRLVLADALTYAKRFDPKLVIDVATLTGAALSALGDHASAILTRDQKLSDTLTELGDKTGDYVWPLPLWDMYVHHMNGRFGDLANIQTSGDPRYAGTITAGVFLEHFAKDYKKDCSWCHIDMAPRMTSTAGDNLAKGAAGEPVKLLVELAKDY